MTWRNSAACRDMPGDRFFPTATVGPVYEAQVAAAKRVCSDCLVRTPCLAEALAQRDQWGVFGGLTGEERAALLRRKTGKPRSPLVRLVRPGAA